MMLTRIAHGPLTAVARADVFMVIRALEGKPGIDKELGVHLWHALGSERGIQKAVSLLAQVGLEEMPEFALVHPGKNSLHVIVRGNFNVLLLNHNGTYSSVGAEGVATWREYTALPASEWCIRSAAGISVDDGEAFYLASGVSRVAVMASLGWDDPDTPETASELLETGAISPDEFSSRSVTHQTPLEQTVLPPETPQSNVATISMPVVESDFASDPLENGVEEASVRIQPAVIARVPISQASQRLQPINAPAIPAPEPDESNTVLTSNLVELRQAMEQDSHAQAPTEVLSVPMPAPVPALKLSNGVRIPLDRTVLIGRAPEASRLSLRELPRLVNVASPNNDVSRTHAQVRIEGEFVLVTDLNSTNGVFLIEPGQAPRRLHPDEPAQLLPGVTVDLGDGATFELEVAP